MAVGPVAGTPVPVVDGRSWLPTAVTTSLSHRAIPPGERPAQGGTDRLPRHAERTRQPHEHGGNPGAPGRRTVPPPHGGTNEPRAAAAPRPAQKACGDLMAATQQPLAGHPDRRRNRAGFGHHLASDEAAPHLSCAQAPNGWRGRTRWRLSPCRFKPAIESPRSQGRLAIEAE